MAGWKIQGKAEYFRKSLTDKYHPVVLALLKNRGIEKEEEIDNFFDFDYEKNLTDPMGISGMEKILERIKKAKENGEKVAIFGDYDADGVTATVLVYETLRELGIKNVVSYIPDRQIEGYGMNENAVKYLKKEGVSLIITVDCGITNVSEIEKAKDLGIDVIVTDHHHVPEILPEALAIINPNIPDSGFKNNELAGVGVAFKLAQAVYGKFLPEKIDQLKWALDLAGVGTVADCVPLLGENRILTKYGLVVLSKTRRVGFREMFKVGRINIDENNPADTQKVAFQIAPRINAAGRMDHANFAYNLIIENDKVKARELALEVEGKNQERQKMTSQIVREIQIIAQNSFRERKFIFAANPNWPAGILGLVAGKIAEEFRKPTLVCQKQEKEMIGSLRSVPEVDIMDVLEECQEVLEKFGGHAQAAGIKLANENAEKFYELFGESVEKRMAGKEVETFLSVDMEIGAEDVDWQLLSEIRQMEPFGIGNPEPVFVMRNMNISDLKICGNGHKHLKLSLNSKNGNPKIFDSIGFSMGDKFSSLKKGDTIDIVFNLREDEWNGSKKMQLNLLDIKIL